MSALFSPSVSPAGPGVLFSRSGPLGVVSLNRPESLNALTLDMVMVLHEQLDTWKDDPEVSAIFIQGAGDKAFCAGGDLKEAYAAIQGVRQDPSALEAACRFFDEEYRLNRKLWHYPKPVIAFMNGITMGGGYGVAGPSKFRIACESTEFSMPEVKIGFFPDVGGAYYLNRFPGMTGRYAVLTGMRVKAKEDLLYTGVATHYVPSARRDVLFRDLVRVLEALPDHGQDSAVATKAIETLLQDFHEKASEEGLLEMYRDGIDMHFGVRSVESILSSLELDGNYWAQETLSILHDMPPLSLKVALKYLLEARDMSFDDVSLMDGALARRFLSAPDFAEGIRVTLLEKGKTPRWSPSCLEDISEELLESCFDKTVLSS